MDFNWIFHFLYISSNLLLFLKMQLVGWLVGFTVYQPFLGHSTPN